MGHHIKRDRRAFPRVDVALHLHIVFKDLDELVESYSKNLSEGGIFVKTDNPLPVGSVVKLQISLVHQSLTYLEAKGEVVHVVDKPRKGQEKGMGIRFVKMCEESKKFLKDFVLSRMAEKETAVSANPRRVSSGKGVKKTSAGKGKNSVKKKK
jgi:type IV pilus assembly protein PilZ